MSYTWFLSLGRGKHELHASQLDLKVKTRGLTEVNSLSLLSNFACGKTPGYWKSKAKSCSVPGIIEL